MMPVLTGFDDYCALSVQYALVDCCVSGSFEYSKMPGCDFSTLTLHDKTTVELTLSALLVINQTIRWYPFRRLEIALVFRFVRIFAGSKV